MTLQNQRDILDQMDVFEQQHGYQSRVAVGILEGGDCYLFLRVTETGNVLWGAPPACCIIRGEHVTFYEGEEARELLQKYRITPNSTLF